MECLANIGRSEESYLFSSNGIITSVNDEFINFTGFTIGELIGKSLTEISHIIRFDLELDLDNVNNIYSGFIFTKFMEVREVNISLFLDKEKNKRKYVFSEKPNSRFEEKFTFVEQMLKENIISVAVCSVLDFKLLKINRNYINLLNPPFNKYEDIIGRSFKEIMNRCLKIELNTIWEELCKKKGTVIKKDLEVIGIDNRQDYWDFTITPIFEDKKMKYVVVNGIKVTESVLKNRSIETQKKIIEKQKEQLEEKNSYLKSVLDNLSEGVMISDKDGKIIMVNKEGERLFLNSKEFYMDTDIQIYDNAGEKVGIENYPPKRIGRGEKFKNTGLTLKLPNNTVRLDTSGTPICDKEGEFLFGISCWKDMTIHYKQQEILKNRNEFLNRLIYNLELPIIGLKCKDLEIVKINQSAFNNISRYRPDIKTAAKMKGNKITDIVPDFERSEYFEKIIEVRKEKKTKYLNKVRNFVNGKEIYWNLIFEPIFEFNGELREILVIIIDITAEISDSIIMEKTLKSQEEFLANISHELKTPLNVIFATAQLLYMYCTGSSLEEKKDCIIKYIDSIKQNSYRLSKLINNIVDLSKIEAGFFELKLSNKNIVEVVEELVMSVTNFSEIRGVNIIFDTNTEEKVIACDAEKLERIILNLLSNAIKFSNKGDEIFVEVKDNNEFVEISVKDNGIGIELNDLDKIFDRFKQVDKSLSRNSEGTGIGLSLVKSFVELHGGNIKVKSKVGYGSEFIVALPSRNVLQENMLCNSNIRNRNESIQVEFSDVYY